MKILSVIGARPQFIKAATISRAISARPKIREIIVHTGQHYDPNISDIFFDQMDIPKPKYNLGLGGGTHGTMTGRQLERIEEILLAEVPDMVLVYGDTNSTLAGALAAVKLHIPIAHIEAGLRSFNKRMPEEINRVICDHISDLLFVPTETAKDNLLTEGIMKDKIFHLGDIMYDAALFYRGRSEKPRWYDSLGIRDNGYVLCTIHRAENTENLDKLQEIFNGLEASGRPVILPLHPRTKGRIAEIGLTVGSNIFIVEPVGYLEMVWLEMHCQLIATDSGGVQKEAFFHRKPCVTLREETEWVELVDVCANILVGSRSAEIASAISTARWVEPSTNPFGNGDAAEKIVKSILKISC